MAQRITLRVIGSVALVLAVARDAHACSCMPSGPPCQAYFQVDAVFAGTVQAITATAAGNPPGRNLRVEFSAVTPYRGTEGTSTAVITADSGAACGFAFEPGERYLVYAYRSPNGAQLEVSSCSRTRPIARATEDLAFVQRLDTSSPSAGARVYGAITHAERSFATNQMRDYGPVAGVVVTLRGPGVSFDTRTNTEGRFEFIGVPPARYDVRAMPPPLFSTRYLERPIEVRDPRGCASADFALRYDGRITGSLQTSSGAPAEGVAVEAIAAERLGNTRYIDALHASVDGYGRFEFQEVPPGRYVVGVNLRQRANTTAVTTYHPGTPDAAQATVVEVGEGERRTLEPMKLPPP